MQHDERGLRLKRRLFRIYFNEKNTFHFDRKSVTLHYKCKYYTLTLMNRLHIIIFALSCLIAASCSNRTGYNHRLDVADSLLNAGAVDSAYSELCSIKPQEIRTTEDSAFFYLLHTQATYRMYKPVKSMEGLNFAIRFYSDGNRNREKLATAFFYKGNILYGNGDAKNGIKYLKNAEFIAEGTKNHELRHKIYEAFVVINEAADENAIAMKYSWKSLRESEDANKKNWIAHAYNNLAVIYAKEGEKDSSEIFLKKSMVLLKFIPKRDRLFIMNNIGVYFMKNDKERAKRYFLQILKTSPIEEAYENLASIYASEGNSKLADEMWRMALRSGNLQVKDDVLHAMFRNQTKNADFIAAAATAERLINLKDSMMMKRDDVNLKAMQAEFDNINSRQVYERKMTIAIAVIIILTLCASIALLYLRYKQYKTKAAMSHDQMMIRSYESQIVELKKLGENREKEIEAINRRKEKLLEKHRDTLNRGYSLYSDIMRGKTTVLWKKRDFECVIEYFRLVDVEFVDRLDNMFDDLSPKYKFFLILEHIGKTDAEIMTIMGVAEVSLRSIRSRVNKKSVVRG